MTTKPKAVAATSRTRPVTAKKESLGYLQKIEQIKTITPVRASNKASVNTTRRAKASVDLGQTKVELLKQNTKPVAAPVEMQQVKRKAQPK